MLGYRVGVGARNGQRREVAVGRLREAGVEVFGVPLDVTDDDSVSAAALVEDRAGRLDVLVTNAGITGGGPQLPTTVDPAVVRVAVATSEIGVICVTNAMLPMLRRAGSAPRTRGHGYRDRRPGGSHRAHVLPPLPRQARRAIR